VNQKGFLLIVRGLPGSGKTTAIDRATTLSASLRLDPDKVDTLSSEFVSFSEQCPKTLPVKKKIYRYLLRKACVMLHMGKIVVWEQPWRSRDLFILTLENIAVIGYDIQSPDISALPFAVIIVEIYVSSEEALTRVSERSIKGRHPLTPEDFSQFNEPLEPFNNLGFPFARFDGTQTPSELARDIETFISTHRKDVV